MTNPRLCLSFHHMILSDPTFPDRVTTRSILSHARQRLVFPYPSVSCNPLFTVSRFFPGRNRHCCPASQSSGSIMRVSRTARDCSGSCTGHMPMNGLGMGETRSEGRIHTPTEYIPLTHFVCSLLPMGYFSVLDLPRARSSWYGGCLAVHGYKSVE